MPNCRASGFITRTAAGGDGAHREFLVAGESQLAHDEYIQRRMQRLRHLEADGHAAAGQREHDHVVAVAIPRQRLREQLSGMAAVVKAHARYACG
jgi:hypothetical protein